MHESCGRNNHRIARHPLVSITTATLNSEKTISRTIESVLGQTYDNIEYIVIDGASQDRTLEVAEGYREQFRKRGYRFKIMSEQDSGMYDAINKGIRMSSGVLIGNINSDDWYEPDAVEKVVDRYLQKPFDLAYGDLNIVMPNGRIRLKRARKSSFMTSRNWNHPTQFARRKLYLAEPYRGGGMYDDFDLFLRVTKKGYRIEVINESLANFTTTGMSHKRSVADVMERYRERYRIYRRNGYSRWYLLECVFTEVLKYMLG